MPLLQELQSRYPSVTFKAGDTFYWSSADQVVYYQDEASASSSYSLLHELGHALLEHQNYETDLELVMMEREAWDKAHDLSQGLNVAIPDDYIEDCLDSYRDWLVRRSRCPDCQLVGLQSPANQNYKCVNCKSTWQVPRAQQCAVRRRKL